MKRRVLVVTGSRSEFGLLRPVMAAVKKRRGLELLVVVAGEHLLKPALTWQEVANEFRIDAKVPMQRTGDKGRMDHAAACARGMEGFAKAFKKLKPDWVVVLGDRIEAFAAASAASIGGVAVCHIHGGDRAEGIADEAMRHAITKLSHLHCAATEGSAGRIVGMGEDPKRVHVVGSPAIDGLSKIKALNDAEARRWGDPYTVVLLHPSGLSTAMEKRLVERVIDAVDEAAVGLNILALAPNGDPGREVIVKALASRAADKQRFEQSGREWWLVDHLPRPVFIALLKRMAQRNSGDGLIGNSSAGLIECAVLGLQTINVGPRQDGRERAGNVMDVPFSRLDDLEGSIGLLGPARIRPIGPDNHFGDGRAGERIAGLLARVEPGGLLRKRNAY